MKSILTLTTLALLSNAAFAADLNWHSETNLNANKALTIANKCGGNDGGKITEVYPYDEEINLEKLKQDILNDEQHGRNECKKAHVQSTTQAEAYQEFIKLTKDKDAHLSYCVKKDLKHGEVRFLKSFLQDKTHRMVFSSTYTSNFEDDNLNYAENCYYYNFYVYTKDYTLVKLTFNYTD